MIPTCKANEIYNIEKNLCFCKNGYERINSVCVKIEVCGENEYWNSVECVCKSGYMRKNGKCEPNPVDPPSCPYNSHFNGIKCICN